MTVDEALDEALDGRSEEPADAPEPNLEEDAGDERADKSATDREEQPRLLSRRSRIVVALLAVLTVALLAGGLTLWLQVRGNAAEDRQRDEALSIAERQAVTLITVNPDNVKEQISSLQANSTGEFRRQFDAASPTFRKVIADGKVTSEGSVTESGVVRMSERSGRILVALDSTVRNDETEEPESRRYRLQVDVEKEGDRWLVSNMMFVP